MKSWKDAKKRLEEDFLAPSLRGRVTYFVTRYSHAHDDAGRAAILVDGKEVLQGFDMDWWMHFDEYEAEALRRFPELRNLDRTEFWSQLFDKAADLGCISIGTFYDAYETFTNESIEESLNGKNGLVKLFAILDRRVGKRRLRTLWDAGWGREPEYLFPFFLLRLEAERVMEDSKDVTFVSGHEKFNYRVCAVIITEDKILAMHDERSPYYYLPGGRVRMGETAEHAVIREVEEELNIKAKIVRPLWLNQGFFTEDVDQLQYHEICLYFLMNVSETDLLERGERFTLHEGQHIHDFEWLPFERLQREYFYPIFLKTAIFDLPEHLTIQTERE